METALGHCIQELDIENLKTGNINFACSAGQSASRTAQQVVRYNC